MPDRPSIRPSIIPATGNKGKLREIRRVLIPLGVNIVTLDELSDIPEPDETGETFAENARLKALYYSSKTNKWALADDSGLQVDALNGNPGVRSARYASENCKPNADRKTIDQENNLKLLDALKDIPDEKRTAQFTCYLALAKQGKVIIEASGEVRGKILREPRGYNGFGYDPLFYIDELARTAAQLSADEKNEISHRGNALRKFAKLLKHYLDENAEQPKQPKRHA